MSNGDQNNVRVELTGNSYATSFIVIYVELHTSTHSGINYSESGVFTK